MSLVHPGLCGGCAHARVIVSAKGSRFWLCRAAAGDPRLRRYPPLPVLSCPAFEVGEPTGPRTDGPDPQTPSSTDSADAT